MDPYVIWGSGNQERGFTYVYDVVNVREPPLLIPTPPDDVGVHPVQGLLYECRDRVRGIELSHPVDGQVSARGGLHPLLSVIDYALQLTHQFREPVEVVAALPAITRAEYIVFSKQVLRILLQRIRVNTGRGAVVEPLHSCRLGCIDHVMVDRD